ncbi:hypothetical protein HETIRDRAFT_482175 [Heterobasidion irregulare TC 32-1]|uniref:Mug135-like C-terminal domain-containing protein n=1 Tax=Heterobasidion irregulare (strain TC 32-1) TaxID=747525 RepID=W4JQT5_HETIT|nr:uncharacterized protein HETIRDRAFT_482175 [Heterobasidion irregulare TC 32-1]ETW75445.1 hypothetical protein HETIRDRAFT_482175 [Heterobasidion irregulare TC 32-1]
MDIVNLPTIPLPQFTGNIHVPAAREGVADDAKVSDAALLESRVLHYAEDDKVPRSDLAKAARYKAAIVAQSLVVTGGAMAAAPAWFQQYNANFEQFRTELNQKVDQHHQEFVQLRQDFTQLRQEFVQHRQEFVQHRQEFVQHRQEFVQHRQEFLQHRTEFQQFRTRATNDMAKISKRQALTHRQVALANNRKAGVEGFEEVPFPNGTYPSETLVNDAVLTPLTSVDVVTHLGRGQSRKYFACYFPGVAIPGELDDCYEPILRAIGCRVFEDRTPPVED